MAWENFGASGQLARRPVAVQGRARQLRINPQTGGVEDEQGRAVADLSQDEATQLAFGGGGEAPKPAAPAPSADFTPSLAPARERQKEFATDREALASGASMASQLPSGKWVAGGEEAMDRALGGSANTMDQLAFIRRTMPQLYNRAMGMNGGMAPVANEQLMRQIRGDAEQAAAKIFEGDTQRSQVGLGEFTQAVRGREQDQLSRDNARLQADTQLELSRMAGKSALKTSQAQAAAQIAASPMTPEQKRAALQMQGEAFRDVESAYRGQQPGQAGGPRVRLESGADGLPVAVTGPGGPARSGDSAKSLSDATAAAKFARQFGFLPPEQPGQPEGKFDVDALTLELAKNPALANDPTVHEALRKGSGGMSAQGAREVMFKKFARLANEMQQTGPIRGADYGGLKFHRDVSQGTDAVVGPDGRLLYQKNFPVAIPGARWLAGQADLFPTFRDSTRREYQQQLSALGAALRGAYGQ
jgi:hypothetical protein